MTARRRSAVSVMCLGIMLAVAVSAQPAGQRPVRVPDDAVTFESFCRSVHGDSSDVDVLFRFRHDHFVFVRQAGSQRYIATAEVSVEILDSTESSVSRHIQSFTISSDDNSLPSLRSRYWQDVAAFHLPRGRYTALCTVTDKEAEHAQFQVRIPLVMPRSRAALSSLLLAQSFDSAAGVVPCNLGGNAFFNGGLCVVAALRPADGPVTAVYSLTRALYDGEEHIPFQRDTTVPLIVMRGTRLVPTVDSNHAVVYRFVPDPLGSVGILPLHGEQLPQGRYELGIRFGAADTATLRLPFAMRWIDMPQSLRDLDFASAAMKYITTEDEQDRLTGGRHASRVQAFETFWKKQDPTPTTAYNERLAEYFRRVDYAFQTFRTLKEENGIFTDRGKIYILYGSPSSKERLFSRDNAPREVWHYTALNKLFTFEDSSRQGNYKLIQTDTK